MTSTVFIAFLLACPSCPLAAVVINEIMYHPLSERDEHEYVELFNAGDMVEDLSDWSFSSGISYHFPVGTLLDPGAYLLIAKDPGTFLARYGRDAIGPYEGVLRDSGETLTLIDDTGGVADTVTYTDKPPWPVAADGLGASLECINPYADNAHVSNWRACASGISWQHIEVAAPASSSRLYLYLLGEGECLVDDVRVTSSGQLATVSEWLAYPMRYRHLPGGQQALDMHFSHVAVPFGSEIEVQSLVLPQNPLIKVFAITLTTSTGEVQLDLSGDFNLDGISSMQNRRDGNLDGGGATYASELLPADHVVVSEDPLPPVRWILGSYEDGAYNCIEATGQRLSVPPGRYTGLHLLATAVNTWVTDGVFEVTGPNGSQRWTATVTDWARPLPEGADDPFNLVRNGGFEREGGWTAAGTHSASYRWSGDAHDASFSMRLVARGAGTGGSNSVFQDIPNLPVGETCTLSLWAKGLSGNNVLVCRFSGGSHKVETPLGTNGTPGYRNSVYSNDIPPFITRVFHTPLQPTSNDTILISAKISDGDEILSATVTYRVDDGEWREKSLNDEGTNGDQIRQDGIFSVVIPSAPSKSIVRYKIKAQDNAGQVTDYPLPGEPTPNLGAFVYDREITSKVPIYWIFMDSSAYGKLLSNPQDNNFQRGMFACNGIVYDNIGIRFRGQWARSWPKKSWKLRFNKDNYFDGRRTVNLNSCYHDRAYIREYLCYRFYRESGSQACQAEFVHVRLNGDFYGLELDVEQVNEQFLDRYGFDSNGNLYKSKQAGDLRRLSSEAAFNGPYEKKTNEGEDWSDLKALADGLATTSADRMEDFLIQNAAVEQILLYWAATTITQNWDAIIKNHYLFHDTYSTGRWYMFPWDLDRTWGEYANWDLGARIHILAGTRAHPPGFGLPNDWWNRLIDAMLKQPDMLDQYYGYIRTLLDELFTEERMSQWIDAQQELIEDLVSSDRQKWGTQGNWQSFPQEIRNCKIFVRERRTFLFSSLPVAVETWEIY